MRKLVSAFLLIIFLIPTIVNSSVVLFGHVHEVCTEDGIHYHDHEQECQVCLISVNYQSDIVSYSHKKYITFYKESLINYVDVVFHIFSSLNLFGRAPPTLI